MPCVRASIYKANLTEYNTAAIRGIGAWDAINRRLGEGLHPLGWTRREPGKFAIRRCTLKSSGASLCWEATKLQGRFAI